MKVNEILKSIPSVIGSIFSNIYCVNKNDNEAYKIEFTGDELKVSSPITYEAFTKEISELLPIIVSEVEKNNDLKKVYENKFLVDLKTIDNYKLVFITELEKNNYHNDEKGILLIADDSPVITKFFTKTMEDEYTVLVAKDGNEAIKLIEENRDNKLLGVFVDLQMPIKNGYEVLDYFKTNDLFKDIPVSVISGEDSEDGITKATSYGIVDMLQKPFSADAARSIVNKTVSFSPKNK